MFGAVLVLHIRQQHHLILGSISSLVCWINIYSLVPLPKQLQLPERIQYMCQNEKHTCHMSNFSIIVEKLLPHKLHGKELVFLPLSLLLS
jgi:hypothetical protein